MDLRPNPEYSRREFLRLAGAGAVVLGSGAALARAADALASRQGRPLGVALLGLGSYATGQLGPALRTTRLCRLAGVVSGHPEKAAQWARDYQLPARNLYSYETMDRTIPTSTSSTS
jgi:hypothetical protein